MFRAGSGRGDAPHQRQNHKHSTHEGCQQRSSDDHSAHHRRVGHQNHPPPVHESRTQVQYNSSLHGPMIDSVQFAHVGHHTVLQSTPTVVVRSVAQDQVDSGPITLVPH